MIRKRCQRNIENQELWRSKAPLLDPDFDYEDFPQLIAFAKVMGLDQELSLNTARYALMLFSWEVATSMPLFQTCPRGATLLAAICFQTRSIGSPYCIGGRGLSFLPDAYHPWRYMLGQMGRLRPRPTLGIARTLS